MMARRLKSGGRPILPHTCPFTPPPPTPSLGGAKTRFSVNLTQAGVGLGFRMPRHGAAVSRSMAGFIAVATA